MAITPNPTSSGSSEVQLSTRSRYRKTRLRKDSVSGTVFFGIWRPPEIIETKPSKKHRIQTDEVHDPGLIAHREYGDKTLFWAIAVRNNLMLPMVDIKTMVDSGNSILFIPHIDDVTSALQRASPNSPGTT